MNPLEHLASLPAGEAADNGAAGAVTPSTPASGPAPSITRASAEGAGPPLYVVTDASIQIVLRRRFGEIAGKPQTLACELELTNKAGEGAPAERAHPEFDLKEALHSAVHRISLRLEELQRGEP